MTDSDPDDRDPLARAMARFEDERRLYELEQAGPAEDHRGPARELMYLLGRAPRPAPSIPPRPLPCLS